MPLAPEWPIVSGRASGDLSVEASFEALHALYAATVLVWLRAEVGTADADDLAQDVWSIFARRWRQWDVRPEMQRPEARPIISFLHRTSLNVVRARRRGTRPHLPLDEDLPAPQGAEALARGVEAARWLSRATALCTPLQYRVLLAKLAGVPAREIAATLRVTEAVVDHGYRGAIETLRRDHARRDAGRGDRS